MVIFYSSLHTGGIETFFLRLCKERVRTGHLTTIVLTDIEASDDYLLDEVRKVAMVHSLADFLPILIKRVFSKHALFRKLFWIVCVFLKKDFINVFKGHQTIHVTSPLYAVFALKVIKKFNLRLNLTYGIYHADTFSPRNKHSKFYYLKSALKICNDNIPDSNVMFYNDALLDVYRRDFGIYLGVNNVFPLGVIDSMLSSPTKGEGNANGKEVLRICSVGRIVDFKTYNFWMPELIHKLNASGYRIDYDIYGDGRERGRLLDIIKSNSFIHTTVKEPFNYSDFKKIVSHYDIFIGSGTAIIEAAALGVPSIIGIERINEAKTYGFITDVPGFTYNEDFLYSKVDVRDKIVSYVEMSNHERTELSLSHIRKSKIFSIENCNRNIIEVNRSAQPVGLELGMNLFRAVFSYLYSLLEYSRNRSKTL